MSAFLVVGIYDAAFVDELTCLLGLPLTLPPWRIFLSNLESSCRIVSRKHHTLDVESHFFGRTSSLRRGRLCSLHKMKITIWNGWKMKNWIFLGSRGVQMGEGGFDECNAFWCICNPCISVMSDLFQILELILLMHLQQFCLCIFYLTSDLLGMWWCFRNIFWKNLFFKSQFVVMSWNWCMT